MAIPGVSNWVMGIIKRGYTLQFARRPPWYGGVVSTSVQRSTAHVLRTEVISLPAKGAMETISPAQSESAFYSRYFIVPKKDGGLRLIFDLNRALMKWPFRMITSKQILSQICPGDWFFWLDLKDAYFHIQITPHHRLFLRFAFEGVAYQYTVLPFGLSLASRTFTKCMDAALSPLRQMGIRILNYFDDWLILAQSEDKLLSHRSVLLSHLECLGLRVNFAKSALSPSQRISFLGTVIDSARMRAVVTPEHALAIQELVASFKLRVPRPFKAFQDAGPHGLICRCSSGPLEEHQWMERGVPLCMVCRRKVVLTDTSKLGWVSVCDGKPAFGLWSKKEGYLHINCLEKLVVCLGLHTFLPDLRGHQVLVHSDSMTVVSYINCQGGLSSRNHFILAERLLRWAQLNLCSLRATHVRGKLNLGADMLSRSNDPSDEWTLHPPTVQEIWGIFSKPEVELFASEDNTHCQTYFSKDTDAFAHDWPNLLLYAFPRLPWSRR